MSKEQDSKFINNFALIIGALVGLTIVIFFIANMMGKRASAESGTDPRAQALVVERITPPGQVVVAGASEAAGAVESAGTVAAAANDLGKRTYDQACFACHGTGAAGAPKTGDAADWTARAGQGRDVLIRHSIEGFMGGKGFMPAKGGQTQLSDEAVIAALDYMLEQSK